MQPDNFICPMMAERRLRQAGYEVERNKDVVSYKKLGVSGKLSIHEFGVDERHIARLEDRGS